MARIPVGDLIARLLNEAGSASSGYPVAFSHRELAIAVYGVESPTAAQLSAVRRATARLVTKGRAERDAEREWEGTGRHWRYSETVDRMTNYRNPGGVTVRRVPTAADNAVREEVRARAGLAALEATIQTTRRR